MAAKYLTKAELHMLVIDHLFGVITLADIAQRQHCSMTRAEKIVNQTAYAATGDWRERDPHKVASGIRSLRTTPAEPLRDSPQHFYERELDNPYATPQLSKSIGWRHRNL